MARTIHFVSWLTGRLLKSFKLVIVASVILMSLILLMMKDADPPPDEIKAAKLSKLSFDEGTQKMLKKLHPLKTRGVKTSESVRQDERPPLPKHPLKIENVQIETEKKVQPTQVLKEPIADKQMDLKEPKEKPCYHIHTFYYPWYGNPKFDKEYIHWNHQLLPHWNPQVAKHYPKGVHQPPDDIGSNFFPKLGAYSSRDPHVILSHMQQLSSANIGVVIVSYYPPTQGDDNGKDWQDVFPILLKTANDYGIKVGFHIEPYKNRNQNTVKDDLIHIIDTYSHYPAFFRYDYNGKSLPMIYIYDSYHTKPDEWSQVLWPNGKNSVRGTKYDAFVIGLCVKESDLRELRRGGFDGFYTYFAANGFTYGSSRRNWQNLHDFAKRFNMIFIPSVGPGYVDTRIRPWNGENTRNRLKGTYYKDSWKTALKFQPRVISITSFNEWHEGTQIERAIPHMTGDYHYKDYQPHSPDYYLELTKKFAKEFKQCANPDSGLIF